MQKHFEIVQCGFGKLGIIYIARTKNKQETNLMQNSQ